MPLGWNRWQTRAGEDAAQELQGQANPTVPYIQRRAREIQLQQHNRSTFLQRTLSITHTNDLLAQRVKFNLYFGESRIRKEENRVK